MPDLTYPGASRDLGGYLAVPVAGGRWPGVVVVHDAVGLSDDIREQADRLAAAGYLAFAPDLYSRPRLRCVPGDAVRLPLGQGAGRSPRRGRLPGDIEAARRWLAEPDDGGDRIGVIGLCTGGGFALPSAAKSDSGATSVDYGEGAVRIG